MEAIMYSSSCEVIGLPVPSLVTFNVSVTVDSFKYISTFKKGTQESRPDSCNQYLTAILHRQIIVHLHKQQ
jgi:hypothetical protein